MAFRKYVSVQISATGGGTSTAPTITGADIVSYDDFQDRVVTGVKIGATTAGLRVRVVVGGAIQCEIDAACTSTAEGFIPLNIRYKTGQEFHVDLANFNAGDTTLTPVTLQYEVERLGQ